MLKSTRKVFDVFEHLCLQGPASAVEISTALGLQNTSVHRFLNTLVELGYVRKESGSTRFYPTLNVLRLGMAVSARMDVLAEGKRILGQLAERHDVTATLSSLLNGNVMVFHREFPTQSLTRIMFNQELPAYCSGSGKALLALLPEAELEQYLSQVQFTRFTPNTLVTPEALREDLERIRARGYSEDMEESVLNLYCIAVASINKHSQKGWAISLSMDHSRLAGLDRQALALELGKATRELSEFC